MRSAKTKHDLYKHSQRRALQRYELELDWKMYEQFNHRLMKSIKPEGILFLAKESERLTHYLIDDKYIVVFDKNRKGITTFLPADAINNYTKGSDYMQVRREYIRP